MSNNIKVKVYKNPARNIKEPFKPYIPQYQVLGVEPEIKNPVPPNSIVPITVSKDPLDSNNTRSNRVSIRQPYAETVNSPIGRGRGPLPNVGNNIEQTWSSVDGEIIDDIFDPPNTNQPMIDNNEFVSAAALGLPNEPVFELEEELPELDEVKNPPKKTFLTENELQDTLKSEYLCTLIKQINEEEYLILIDGNPICSGPLDYIQEQTTALVFGEHELYNGNPVSIDDIIVIKRVPIKVGVFLS